MGKKSAINSLSKIIANVTMHKVLLEYTNKPESVNHLSYEIIEYRDTAVSKADEFNWNISDKEKIRLSAMKHLKKKMARKYEDVKFQMKDALKLLNQTMREVGL